MEKKIEKSISIFEIFAFELVALNTSLLLLLTFCVKHSLLLSQYVNKHSQNLRYY